MVFDVSVALTWILFLALFPIAFYWFRRAWRILVKRDFSEVALKRGESPANPEKFAPYAAAINFIAGIIIVFVIIGIVSGSLEYETWSAIAGSTLWMKFIFDFILSRQAHPIVIGRKKGDSVPGK
jgi:small-conductance mechanosensitive channel